MRKKIQIMLIDPAKAQDLLDKHRRKENNRIERDKLERYMALMRAGKWMQYRGMPIKISGGILLDGHHRLTAIAESGVKLYLPVQIK